MILRGSKKCEQSHVNHEKLDVFGQAPCGVINAIDPSDFKVKPVKCLKWRRYNHLATDEISQVVFFASDYFKK